jgi:peptidoglycan hydrolase CwlO-like protein
MLFFSTISMIFCKVKNCMEMFKKYIPIILLLFAPLAGFSQEPESPEQTDTSLEGTFRDLYESAETYQNYKVIKITTLNSFWQSVQDSLKSYKQEIGGLKGEIVNLNSKIDDLNVKIGELESALQQSRNVADGISFLGLLIKKQTYNIIVWSIIFGLIILVLIGYLSHVRSQKLYTVTRKEFMKLVDDFESLKKTSHEKKIKLGRELQTERNKVMELESRLKDNSDRFTSRRNSPA